MPEICRFFGIVVGMFYRDHGPPHFHAFYGDYDAVFEIETGLIRGEFPLRAKRLVLEWARMHREELLEDWGRVRAKLPLKPIEPLR